jgi:putative salt-induced outer membrane protein YdiY
MQGIFFVVSHILRDKPVLEVIMNRLLLVFLAIIVSDGAAKSEVVVFKNGDQLTGSWVRVTEDKILFKSEALGEIPIPVSKVKTMTSKTPAVILAKAAVAYSGRLSLLESGEWELRGEDGGTRRVPAAAVVAIHPMEVYRARGEEAAFRPFHNWQGQANLGYSLVRGDRDASTLSLGVSGTRRFPNLPGFRERFRTNYLLTMLFANTRMNGVRTSANSITTSLRQDFLFSPANFVFALGQLEHSQTQSLDLRQTYGGGFGRDLLQPPRLGLQLLGGMTYVREDFAGPERRQNAEALVGEKLSWKISNNVNFTNHLNFYPNLTDRGEYRADTTSTLSLRISSRLSFNTTIADRFLTNPLPGKQKNEVVLTTGLGLDF